MSTTIRNENDENGDSLFARLKARAEHKKTMIDITDRRCGNIQTQRREVLERLRKDCFSGSVSSLEVDLTDDDGDSSDDCADIAFSRFSASPTSRLSSKHRVDSMPQLPSSSDREPRIGHTHCRSLRSLGGLELEEELDYGHYTSRWSSERSGGSYREDNLSATLGKASLYYRNTNMLERNLIPPEPADQDFIPSSLPTNWPISSYTDMRWHGEELSSDTLLSPTRR